MAEQYTGVDITGYNSNPPADDGSQVEANRVKWSTIKEKLNDPVKSRTDDMDSAISAAFGKVDGGVTTVTTSYVVLSTDQGKLVRATNSGITITTPDATDVDEPFVFDFSNGSSGNVTLDGSGSQTIDGAGSITVPAGAGCRLRTDGANWFTSGQNFLTPALFPGFLSGLELSAAGSSATFGIAAGTANDSTNAALMALASAYTKTTSAWAVGSGNGALDTGAIATSTWYHVFLIKRIDTGVVDVLVSLSATAPTMPASYTLKRRIGAMKTDGSSQWTKFTQTGDDFIWDASVVDVNNIATVASRVNKTLTVPTGVVVRALFRAAQVASGSGIAIIFTSLQESDQTPVVGTFNDMCCINLDYCGGAFERLTNTSAQIGVRSANANGFYSVNTYGWRDTRGK